MAKPEGWLAKYRLDDENFEPVLDRLSTERRVLGHITDELHVRGVPRNTLEQLDLELGEDPHTDYTTGDTDELDGMLQTLVDDGLVEQRDDGSYKLTDLGFTELAN